LKGAFERIQTAGAKVAGGYEYLASGIMTAESIVEVAHGVGEPLVDVPHD
jgi:hypothetical protein